MSNSIIDQQRDNADFEISRSAINGKVFMKNFLTGTWTPEYNILPDGVKNLMEHLFNEINAILKKNIGTIANS